MTTKGDRVEVLRDNGRVGEEPPAQQKQTYEVPVLPLVGSVVYPKSIHPLSLRGEQAARLVEAARSDNGLVALFMQREAASEPPTASDLHTVGTLVRLGDVQCGPGGLIDVSAEGLKRVRLLHVKQWEPYVLGKVAAIDDLADPGPELEEVTRQVRDLYRSLLTFSPTSEATETLFPVLEATESPADLAYLVAATVLVSPAARQSILETDSVHDRLRQLVPLLEKANEMQRVGPPADSTNSKLTIMPLSEVKGRNSKLKTSDLTELQHVLLEAGLPPEAERLAERELNRVVGLNPSTPDYNLARTYLQWLADLPWRNSGEPPIDLDRARAVLDQDHYGLDDVKQRIIEYLAVRKLRRERQSDFGREPILCLLGPPGIGKTSLGRSIAEALGRPFVRISLGGVSDEAEIRGHRRTYLGAMPGKIIRSLARLGANHPVIMLDEIDKIGSDGKGDPASALLEVLDPEQQRGFLDNYLDVPFDLSCVFFIATANLLDSLPPALSDRLEVIQLAGYTEEEKAQIALRHIIPAQMESHALHESDAAWEHEAVLDIVRNYTREAGVRQLEREIATVCRRIAVLVTQAQDEGRGTMDDLGRPSSLVPRPHQASLASSVVPYKVDSDFIADVLGGPRYLSDQPEVTDQPGIATGVVWTPVGGDIIYVEASMMPGGKTLTITGQLGDIMRESAQAALSYVRSRALELHIDPNFFERHDLHIHVPSGAVQKDGPSAGVTMAVALTSLLAGVAVPSDVAMTGEITLRGRVLPVGGIKEKVLAARRTGIRRLVLPAQNRRDLEDLPPEMLDGLDIVLADNMGDVFSAAGLNPERETGKPRTVNVRKRQPGPYGEPMSMPRVARSRRE